MKIRLITFGIIFCSLSTTYAMGGKRPAPQNEKPQVSNLPLPTSTPPAPTIDLGADLAEDEYLNTSSQVGPEIDLNVKETELSKLRTKINDDSVDKCFREEENSDKFTHDEFSDQISYYSQMMIKDVPAMVGFIGSSYGTSSNDSQYFPTSLIRHPLCKMTKESLAVTLKNVPSEATIAELNLFAEATNSLRLEVIKGDMKAKAELLSLWSRFFSCLAYTESLTSADNHTSLSVAAKYSPSGYRKPAGVEFYEDSAQPAVSRLNIGTYQFTPDKNGNITPCLKAWNKMHPTTSCQLPLNGTQADLIRILGSSLQSFNIFCGVHKLVETFSIQVNTNKSSATHPDNKILGKLKGEESRCVTPHFYAGRAYNHFGPLQNSTGSNMAELFSCILHN